jgi:acyl-CoA synthetase (AMP-forming)/AMP-acid ligase II
MVHPQGNSPEFIIEVLRAWRARAVVCPLEGASSTARGFAAAPFAVLPSQDHARQPGVPRAVAFTEEQLAPTRKTS